MGTDQARAGSAVDVGLLARRKLHAQTDGAPQASAEQAYVDHAYDCLERMRAERGG